MPAPILLDRAVRDELVLETIAGAMPYLREAVAAIPTAEPRGRSGVDSLHVTIDGSLRDVSELRLFRSAGVALGPIDVGVALRRLTESLVDGALSALDTAGPIRFRVGPIGARRWELRDRIQQELGWVNDPGRWDVNVEARGEMLTAQLGGLHASERLPALDQLSASTNVVVAAVLVRVAKVQSGVRVYDPYCGSGAILAEAARAGAVVLGSDIDRHALAMARRNRARLRLTYPLLRADARAAPVQDHAVECVVSNMPFGKRVGTHASNKELYPAFLRELARILTPGGRAALLTEDKKLMRDALQRTKLRVLREVVLEVGGLHPTAYVVAPPRPRAAKAPARR